VIWIAVINLLEWYTVLDFSITLLSSCEARTQFPHQLRQRRTNRSCHIWLGMHKHTLQSLLFFAESKLLKLIVFTVNIPLRIKKTHNLFSLSNFLQEKII